jgi:hypothetical protein
MTLPIVFSADSFAELILQLAKIETERAAEEAKAQAQPQPQPQPEPEKTEPVADQIENLIELLHLIRLRVTLERVLRGGPCGKCADCLARKAREEKLKAEQTPKPVAPPLEFVLPSNTFVSYNQFRRTNPNTPVPREIKLLDAGHKVPIKAGTEVVMGKSTYVVVSTFTKEASAIPPNPNPNNETTYFTVKAGTRVEDDSGLPVNLAADLSVYLNPDTLVVLPAGTRLQCRDDPELHLELKSDKHVLLPKVEVVTI